jgi:branched-chain amino acid transport system substrate-binding protein
VSREVHRTPLDEREGMNRNWVRGLAVTALLSLLAACGGDGGSEQGTVEGAEKLPVAVISPLSGSGAGFGWALAGAAQIAIDKVNADGGIELDGQLYELEAKMVDDKYSPEGTLAAYNELIKQEGIQILMGPMGSASGLAIKDQIEADQLIAMGNTYTPEMITEDTNYYFRVNATSNEVAPALWAGFSEKYPEANRLAVIGPDDATGKGGADLTIKAAAGEEVEMVSTQFYERGTTDFSAAVTALLASNPEVIDTITSPSQDAGLIMKTARQRGYTGKFMKTGGTSPADILAVAGPEATEGLFFGQAGDLSDPEVKAYIEEFQKLTDVPFDSLSIDLHDGFMMGLDALKKAGTLDSDKWVEAMESMEPYEGPLKGELTWGGEKTYGAERQMLGKLWIYEVQNGEPTVIGTAQEEAP